MKKKTAPKKSSAKKTVKSTAPRSSSHSTAGDQVLIFRRLVVISACVVLAVGVMGTFDRPLVRGVVEGASTVAGLDDQATVLLPTVPNAVAFNIYYRKVGSPTFDNAVRNIPANDHYYIISNLSKDVNYEYRYAAIDKNGSEFLFSDVKPLDYNLTSM